jgi:hypothetical protein
MTNIRSVMGSMDLDELLSNRDAINDRLLRVVDQAAAPWGIKITRVEIKDIAPPLDLVEAMGRQMKAEREKRADVLEAEGFRNAQILRAEGAKQSAILEAEGRRDAAFRDAEARERLAEAEAKATQMMSTAIAEGDITAINYFVAQKYTEALGQIASAPNQKVILMPLEASSLIGSLGGIGAIAQEVFGKDGGDNSSPVAGAHRPATTPAPARNRHRDIPPLRKETRKHDREHRQAELGPWSWWIIGLVFLGLEILIPGVFLLWVGLAAMVVGALSFMFWDMAFWGWQCSWSSLPCLPWSLP